MKCLTFLQGNTVASSKADAVPETIQQVVTIAPLSSSLPYLFRFLRCHNFLRFCTVFVPVSSNTNKRVLSSNPDCPFITFFMLLKNIIMMNLYAVSVNHITNLFLLFCVLSRIAVSEGYDVWLICIRAFLLNLNQHSSHFIIRCIYLEGLSLFIRNFLLFS